MAVVTKTLKTTGGDYSSMATWESTEQTDLVADGDTHVLECYAGEYSGNFDLNGWTTGVSNFITIRAAAGEEHGGVIGAGCVLTSTNITATARLYNDYTVVQDLQFENTNSSASFSSVGLNLINFIEYCTVERCIITSASTKIANTIAALLVSAKGSVVRNNLAISYGGGNAVSTDQRASPLNEIDNNTFIGTGDWTAVNTTTAIIFRNNVFTDDVDTTVTTHSGSTSHNAFGGTGAFGTSQVTGVVLTDGVDFVEPSTGDYQPTSTGKLAGEGTSLSWLFVDDITGTPRSDAALFVNADTVTMANGDIVHYKD